MSVTMRIEGLGETLASFDRLGDEAVKEGTRAMRATAEKVRTDATKFIQRGPKTGRIYERGRGLNLSPVHQASAPGEAPATDTGNLAGSGRATAYGLTGEVKFTAEYAYYLEHGTLRMSPRPFLTPAMKDNESYLVDQLMAAAERAAKRFGK